jgi:large subunit ribosomal protein L5
MQVPKLEKIVINQGVGQAVADKKLIDVAIGEFTILLVKKLFKLCQKRYFNFKLRKKCLLV